MANKGLVIRIDSAVYDKQANMSVLEGWAINPATRRTTQLVSTDERILFSRTDRPDIRELYAVKTHLKYGFCIQLPGDYRTVQTPLLFKSGSYETLLRPSDGAELGTGGLKKFIKRLRREGIASVASDIMEMPRAGKQLQPPGPCQDYITENEPLLWSTAKPEATQKISVLLTLSGTPNRQLLTRTLRSFAEQTYKNTQLVITVSGKPLSEKTTALIQNFADKQNTQQNTNNPALPVTFIAKPCTTAADAMNTAAKAATGSWLALLDLNDVLAPQALTEMALAIEKHPNTELLYSDEDKIDLNGERFAMRFKPGWDPVRLKFHNAIGHLLVLKKSLYEAIGGERTDYTGLSHYDLILRAAGAAQRIVHVPLLCYHATQIEEKDAAAEESRKALGAAILTDYYSTSEHPVSFTGSEFKDAWDAHYIPVETCAALTLAQYTEKEACEAEPELSLPLVTILFAVPAGESDSSMKESAQAILRSCDYPNYRLTLVNCEPFSDDPRIHYCWNNAPHTKLELYNYYANKLTQGFVLFAEPGFKAVEMIWLTELVNTAMTPQAGIVAPRLYNAFSRIEQAGLSVRNNKRFIPEGGLYCLTAGAEYCLRAPKGVLAAGFGAFMTPVALFKKLNGFNTALPWFEADIDYCLRAARLGFNTIIENNTSAEVTGLNSGEGTPLPELTAAYTQEELTDERLTPRLMPGAPAYNVLED